MGTHLKIVHIFIHSHLRAHMHMYMHACLHHCTYMHMHMHAQVCVCTYLAGFEGSLRGHFVLGQRPTAVQEAI